MDKLLENIDGKVTEVGNSIHQVLNMMKMLETQLGQLVGCPMGNKGRLSGQPQGPEMVKAIQTRSGEKEDHTKEITIEGPEFEMPSQYMKMPPCYFRDMLANKHKMTLCNLDPSVGVVPKEVFKNLCQPELKPMAMCLELGDNSIRYPVGITKDAPVRVGEIKFDIYGVRVRPLWVPRRRRRPQGVRLNSGNKSLCLLCLFILLYACFSLEHISRVWCRSTSW
jgi:hypothetical protein